MYRNSLNAYVEYLILHSSEAEVLPVNLSEHQIHRPNNRHGISQQMASAYLVETPQMGKPRRTNLTSIRSLAAITDHEHTHLSLGCFDS